MKGDATNVQRDRYDRLPPIRFGADGLESARSSFASSDVSYILWKGIDSLYFRLVKLESTANFRNVTFLLQQNMELSERLDRLENMADSLKRVVGYLHLQQIYISKDFLIASKRVWDLEQRPYLLIDTQCSRPGVWLTNTAGEYQIFITSLNYK